MMDQRTNLIGAFVAIMLTMGLNAQSDGLLGIKGGLNSSTLTVNSAVGRTGFHAGIFFRSDPARTFGYQAELLYSMKGAGWSVNIPFINIGQSADIKLNYVDLPIMAVYRPIPALELHGGGYIGLLLNSEYSTTGSLIDLNGDLGQGNFNSIDAGALVGLAVNIGPVQLGARYNFGLANVSRSSAADLILGDAQNRYGQIFASFVIPGTVRSSAPGQ